jgi:hypothetical protein
LKTFFSIVGTLQLAISLFLLFFKTGSLWQKRNYAYWLKNIRLAALAFTIACSFLIFIDYKIYLKSISTFLIPTLWVLSCYVVDKIFLYYFNKNKILKNGRNFNHLTFYDDSSIMPDPKTKEEEAFISISSSFSLLVVILFFVSLGIYVTVGQLILPYK